MRVLSVLLGLALSGSVVAKQPTQDREFHHDSYHHSSHGRPQQDSTCAYRFLHGVASGDPLSDRVVIWTRVTPSQNTTGPLQVRYWVSRDKSFKDVVKSDYVETSAARDYTVKVDVTGLSPSSRYYYKFQYQCARSIVGQTKTLPSPGTKSKKLKFAFVSCSNFVQGYFHVYDHISKRKDLDFVVHLGDYFYEYDTLGYTDGEPVRPHQPDAETVTLEQYRIRHAQYKTDASSIRMHARYPVIAAWDDHEGANNDWYGGAENHQPATEGNWFVRKNNSVTAYFEYMPIRDPARNDISRSFKYGDLAELFMVEERITARTEQLDTRLPVSPYALFAQFPAAEAIRRFFALIDNSTATLLGNDQFNRLQTAVQTSNSKWQIFGTAVIMARQNLPRYNDPANPQAYVTLTQLRSALANNTLLSAGERAFVEGLYNLSGPPVPYDVDAWDGYRYERERLYDVMQKSARNPVVISGDSHSAWAFDLWRIYPQSAGALYGLDNPSDKVGVEFAGPSVTSVGLDYYLRGLPDNVADKGYFLTNPHQKFFKLDFRGYVITEVTPEETKSTYYRLTTGLRDPTRYTMDCYAQARVEDGKRQLEAVTDCDGRVFVQGEFYEYGDEDSKDEYY